MIDLAIALYRAIPYRPRCHAPSRHTWLCRVALPLGLSTKCYKEANY